MGLEYWSPKEIRGVVEEALALSDQQGQEAGEEWESASRTQLLLLRKSPVARCPQFGHHPHRQEEEEQAAAVIRTSVKLSAAGKQARNRVLTALPSITVWFPTPVS